MNGKDVSKRRVEDSGTITEFHADSFTIEGSEDKNIRAIFQKRDDGIIALKMGRNIPEGVLLSWLKFAKEEYFGYKKDQKWKQKDIDKLRSRIIKAR